MSEKYQIILADIPLNIHLRNTELPATFWKWLLPAGHPMYREGVTAEDMVPAITDEEIREEEEYIKKAYEGMNAGIPDSVLEYDMLVKRVSDHLLKHNAFIFHGVAFLWRGKAYIFTAPSGTGKTTQYRRWRELYGDEIRILNGDKPALRFDEQVLVYPSPWHGKEGYARGFDPIPLNGIIFLEQGKENIIRKMLPEEAGIPLFTQLLFTAADEKLVKQGAGLIDRLAGAVPVWKLINRGDHASAKLAHDTILQYEKEQESV